MLQEDASVPMYMQIKASLQMDISSGVYAVDDKIPTETELCNRYGVSRITVRRAVAELVEEGYLIKRQGKGTFVRLHRIDRKIEYVMGFTDSVERAGGVASSEVLVRQITQASDDVARRLGIPSHSDVLYIKRVRKADGIPVMMENNYFDPARFEFLMEEDLSGSLYHMLTARGIRPVNPKTTLLSMKLADFELAREMRVAVGTPFFAIDTLICDQDDRPVHVGRQYCLGEAYTFSL